MLFNPTILDTKSIDNFWDGFFVPSKTLKTIYNTPKLKDKYDSLAFDDQVKLLFNVEGSEFYKDEHKTFSFLLSFDKYINCTFELENGEHVSLYDALSLINYDLYIEDTRDPYKTLYPAHSVILVCILAVMCEGTSTCSSLAKFFNRHKAFLCAVIPDMPNVDRNISADTIYSILNLIDKDKFRSLFRDVFSILYSEKDADKYLNTIVFDGHEVRASYKKGFTSRKIKGAHIISLINADDKHVIAYEIKDQKTNEHKAFLETIKLLPFNLHDCIFMADALNTQKDVIDGIVEHGAFYLMPIKKNAGNRELYNLLDTQNLDDLIKKCHFKSDDIVSKVGGRVDAKKIFVLDIKELDLSNTKIISDTITSIVIYKTERHLLGQEKCETNTMFFITNLPVCDKTNEQIVKSMTQRWSCEQMHHVLDTTMEQDSINACNKSYLSNKININKIVYEVVTQQREKLESQNTKFRKITYQNAFDYNKDHLDEALACLIKNLANDKTTERKSTIPMILKDKDDTLNIFDLF